MQHGAPHPVFALGFFALERLMRQFYQALPDLPDGSLWG